MDDIEDLGNKFIKDTKNYYPRSFMIGDDFYSVVKKYMALRPDDMDTKRFFIRYHNGKCTRQVMGKARFSETPHIVACFLNLPQPELYTGHSFRRTGATLLANAGANTYTLKQAFGWKSDSVPGRYVEHSSFNRQKIYQGIMHGNMSTNSEICCTSQRTSTITRSIDVISTQLSTSAITVPVYTSASRTNFKDHSQFVKRASFALNKTSTITRPTEITSTRVTSAINSPILISVPTTSCNVNSLHVDKNSVDFSRTLTTTKPVVSFVQSTSAPTSISSSVITNTSTTNDFSSILDEDNSLDEVFNDDSLDEVVNDCDMPSKLIPISTVASMPIVQTSYTAKPIFISSDSENSSIPHVSQPVNLISTNSIVSTKSFSAADSNYSVHSMSDRVPLTQTTNFNRPITSPSIQGYKNPVENQLFDRVNIENNQHANLDEKKTILHQVLIQIKGSLYRMELKIFLKTHL